MGLTDQFWGKITRYPPYYKPREPLKVVSLWDYLKEHPGNYEVYDAANADLDPIPIKTPSYDFDKYTYYDKFMEELLRKTAFTDELTGSTPICAGWTCLIRRNQDLFWRFASDHWNLNLLRGTYLGKWFRELKNYTKHKMDEEFYKELFAFASNWK